MSLKICKKCNIEKEILYFPKNKKQKDGYHYYCINCSRNSNKKSYINNREKILKKEKIQRNIIKRKEWYLKDYENNKLKYWNKSKKYKENNREKINQINQIYYKNNKQKIIENCKIWKKEQRKININFKIKENLRKRFYDFLKEKPNKTKKVLQLLGCTLDEFKLYINNQFKFEMTWQNYGKIWEIDHIIPCSKFDLTKEEEQAKCFHYSNMQPLFVSENRKKYNK